MMRWKDTLVSLDSIIQRSVEGIAPIAQKKGMHIHATRALSLPPILVDEDRLVQVVTNILSNAVKFTPAGGDITIEAWHETAPRNRIIVEISDSGPGIPPAELEFIFDKFHRAGDGVGNSVEGTGLGLSIARQIIEHYGGDIWAANKPAGGSTFTFTVPVLDTAEPGQDTAGRRIPA
jgi:signal transduction histidine kinase